MHYLVFNSETHAIIEKPEIWAYGVNVKLLTVQAPLGAKVANETTAPVSKAPRRIKRRDNMEDLAL